MSSYDELPIEVKENILTRVSPDDYNNMMATSKSNLHVGKSGKNSYMRNNLSHKTITLEADNWLNICNNPLVSKFKLSGSISGDYNENFVIHISGKFFEQDDYYFLYGKFNVILKYTIYNRYSEIDESFEFHIKCNFKNNKLDGLYYSTGKVFGDDVVEYREYENGIQMADVYFMFGGLSINFRDQFNRPCRQYNYGYPESYMDLDILFEHYPDLDVSNTDSYDGVRNFVNNVINGNYHEFVLSDSRWIENNTYRYHSEHTDVNIDNVIPNVDKMSIEELNALFNVKFY